MENENTSEIEMLKCEACNNYHKKQDTEIVVIRVVKGKECDLNDFLAPKPTMMYAKPQTEEKEVPPAPPALNQGPPKPLRQVIPHGIAATMIPPGAPNFDAHGAKETRQV